MADKNQDKNQSKNRAEQAEEHDESVLNPEIKNESDLSKKERRLIEKEKLKGMGPKKKLEYIWMYYKPAIFGNCGNYNCSHNGKCDIVISKSYECNRQVLRRMADC